MQTLRDAQARDEQIELVLQSNMIGQLIRQGRDVYYIVDGDVVHEGHSPFAAAVKYVRANS